MCFGNISQRIAYTMSYGIWSMLPIRIKYYIDEDKQSPFHVYSIGNDINNWHLIQLFWMINDHRCRMFPMRIINVKDTVLALI